MLTLPPPPPVRGSAELSSEWAAWGGWGDQWSGAAAGQWCILCSRGPTLLSCLRPSAGWLCLERLTGGPDTAGLRPDEEVPEA